MNSDNNSNAFIYSYTNTIDTECEYYGYNPEYDKLRRFLAELVNLPLLKIPIWIQQHRKELEKLGIKVRTRRSKNE